MNYAYWYFKLPWSTPNYVKTYMHFSICLYSGLWCLVFFYFYLVWKFYRKQIISKSFFAVVFILIITTTHMIHFFALSMNLVATFTVGIIFLNQIFTTHTSIWWRDKVPFISDKRATYKEWHPIIKVCLYSKENKIKKFLSQWIFQCFFAKFGTLILYVCSYLWQKVNFQSCNHVYLKIMKII